MPAKYYESDRAVAEYLLLHYDETDHSNFPVRCVAQLETGRLPASARALDLGCAVGRSSFELARCCAEVVGIDASTRFIAIARQLQKKRTLPFQSVEEGGLTRPRRAVVPGEIDRRRVRFERGDAMNLPSSLGHFDVILLANLIDRLRNPRKCLEQMRRFLRPGGQLIITSPYSWLVEYTPRRCWLGGFRRQGRPVTTFDTLRQILSPHFRLVRRRDLPFLIREHARKFQFGLAEASLWFRRP
jgi:putative 4-mercaptohistidine N1-methyltranferase